MLWCTYATNLDVHNYRSGVCVRRRGLGALTGASLGEGTGDGVCAAAGRTALSFPAVAFGVADLDVADLAGVGFVDVDFADVDFVDVDFVDVDFVDVDFADADFVDADFAVTGLTASGGVNPTSAAGAGTDARAFCGPFDDRSIVAFVASD